MHENCVDEEDGRVVRNTITKAGFTVTNSNRAIAKLAFEGTQYDFLLGSGQGVTGQGVTGQGTVTGQSQDMGQSQDKGQS